MLTRLMRNKTALFHTVIGIGIVVWSVILFSLYIWAASGQRQHFAEIVKLKAHSLASHTQQLRNWIGCHGGVYVEVCDDIKSHPLLAHMPERDIETPSGRKLTLLNSPSVLRHISDDFESGEGDHIKLVSYNPINSSNFPDEWEQKALLALDAGQDAVQDFVSVDDKKFFRLIYPIRIKDKCLTCHQYADKKQKNIVGGLSVTVDRAPYDRLSDEGINAIISGYLSIWIIGFLGLVVFDLSGARLLRNIEFTATHDALTGLNNRREIDCQLNLECERVARYGHALSVMMLDIDHFKRVNDTYGHQEGDETLRAVANIIRQTIRKTDIAGRYGGEEFLVLTPNTSYEGAMVVAQNLNAAIKATPIRLKNGKTIPITVSIGVATWSSDRKTVESLVKSADDALYQAKETGRDRVCYSK